MVFRMVRRSGLLYRIVSSLAAVCFDCPLEVVWLATNTARLGFGTMVRNHDSLAATDARTNPSGAAAPRKWASSHFESRHDVTARVRALGMAARVAHRLSSTRGRRKCQVLCRTHSLACRMKKHTSFSRNRYAACTGLPCISTTSSRNASGIFEAVGHTNGRTFGRRRVCFASHHEQADE